MAYQLKLYASSEDYWRIREFLRRLRIAHPRPSGIWHVGAFDFWRWHWLETVVERPPTELRFWETSGGEIASVLVQGDPGVCHPMADPNLATEDLLHEMLDVAEREFPTTLGDGRRAVFAWSDEGDLLLSGVLAARKYALASGGHATEYNAWKALTSEPAPVDLPAGYALRSMGDVDELPARSLASWRAFHPGEPDEGADRTGDWYRNLQRAPLYRRDLDVVAVAENGDIAAFAFCYFDDVARVGDILLPGSVPSHPQETLERAVIVEILRRLRDLGATGAYLSWYESDPSAVYASAGFTDWEIGRAWKKLV
jgi:mycothiol synthase